MIIDRDKLSQISEMHIDQIHQNADYLSAEWEKHKLNDALWTLRAIQKAAGEAFESVALLQAAKLRELPFEPEEYEEDMEDADYE